MSRLSLALLLLATGCVGYRSVTLRPGTDMALPQDGGIAGDIVESYVCPRGQGDPTRPTRVSKTQCGLVRPDTIGQRPPVPVQIP
jgi:hypothetical protein